MTASSLWFFTHVGPDLLLTSLCVLGAGKTPTLGGGFHVNLGKESRAQTLQNGTLPPDGRGGVFLALGPQRRSSGWVRPALRVGLVPAMAFSELSGGCMQAGSSGALRPPLGCSPEL